MITLIDNAIEKFLQFAPLMAPDLFPSNVPTEKYIQGDNAYLSFTLEKPMPYEQLLEMLVEDLDMLVLHTCSNLVQPKLLHGSVFCKPEENNMNKISFGTNSDGEISSFTLTFFGSLEGMFFDLMNDLELHQKSFRMNHVMREDTIYKLFCI